MPINNTKRIQMIKSLSSYMTPSHVPPSTSEIEPCNGSISDVDGGT